MYCAITSDRIDVAPLLERVRSDADGAVLLFTGVVRNHHDGRGVEGLEYDAYEEMAAGKLQAICEAVGARYEVTDIAAVHRIGKLAIGDVSVAIAVAAPHREAAYRASQEIMERLKREVPIWKRERYTDGAEAWRGGHVPDPDGEPPAGGSDRKPR